MVTPVVGALRSTNTHLLKSKNIAKNTTIYQLPESIISDSIRALTANKVLVI